MANLFDEQEGLETFGLDFRQHEKAIKIILSIYDNLVQLENAGKTPYYQIDYHNGKRMSVHTSRVGGSEYFKQNVENSISLNPAFITIRAWNGKAHNAAEIRKEQIKIDDTVPDLIDIRDEKPRRFREESELASVISKIAEKNSGSTAAIYELQLQNKNQEIASLREQFAAQKDAAVQMKANELGLQIVGLQGEINREKDRADNAARNAQEKIDAKAQEYKNALALEMEKAARSHDNIIAAKEQQIRDLSSERDRLIEEKQKNENLGLAGITQKDEEIADLEDDIAELQEYVATCRERIAELEKELEKALNAGKNSDKLFGMAEMALGKFFGAKSAAGPIAGPGDDDDDLPPSPARPKSAQPQQRELPPFLGECREDQYHVIFSVIEACRRPQVYKAVYDYSLALERAISDAGSKAASQEPEEGEDE